MLEETVPLRIRSAVWVLALLVFVAVLIGWRHFYFLTDDAFITFRYVSNSLLGRGLVWNPPPFSPVEGYTNWLWAILLRQVWSFTGVEPPTSANVLSLLFGYATLAVVYALVWRMELPTRLARHRFAILALVFLGTITNRTFLAWLSSGLETALFSFLMTLWVQQALTPRDRRRRAWIFWLSISAVLAALTRPDGVLLVLATVALLVVDVGERRLPRAEWLGRLPWALPLAAFPLYLLWRRTTYGAWLPNTYHAKYTSPWPESGWRYLGSFVLEYAVWVWLALLAVWLLRRRELGTARLLVVGTLFVHFAYYTLIIGGDHFEYRVYSHLVPLLFVSFAWLAGQLDLRPGRALVLLAFFVAASWPIPWIHHAHAGADRRERGIAVPVAPHLPPGTRWYGRAFDSMQDWLLTRSVGTRQEMHRQFYEHVANMMPSREEGARIGWEQRPVMAISSVGVIGWRLPHVAIIDLHGLNDYQIARTPVVPRKKRHMAHERVPPPGYVGCFRPNITLKGLKRMGGAELLQTVENRTLTDDDIVHCETIFRSRLASGDM